MLSVDNVTIPALYKLMCMVPGLSEFIEQVDGKMNNKINLINKYKYDVKNYHINNFLISQIMSLIVP